mgnify:FL=1
MTLAWWRNPERSCLAIRASRHSADTPQKGYSAVRNKSNERIEILVTAIDREALFMLFRNSGKKIINMHENNARVPLIFFMV